VGMDRSTLERIYEPLFTTKPTGSGLGLALAHQIIQRHGGHIFVESAPGEGTTFFIFLPKEPAAPSDASTNRAAVPLHENRRVLIIEDELEVAAGLETLLALEGMRSEVVHDAASVPAAIERFDPDVILLDVTLGDESGLDVYRTIAERWPDLPVIFSSGHATEKHLESLPRAGYTALLRKPYDFGRLMAEVTKALQAKA
jgi:two-component system cell cycle sensor histidine kinase/response regulator CckA